MADAGLKDSHQASTNRRIELITGEAKRRLWTAEEKAGILSESFRPWAKVAEVARRHGVSRSLLWNWRHEARKRGMVAERAFVPVRVAREGKCFMQDRIDQRPADTPQNSEGVFRAWPKSATTSAVERTSANRAITLTSVALCSSSLRAALASETMTHL
jgi:transposase-like protein